jgi:hypothetical protein
MIKRMVEAASLDLSRSLVRQQCKYETVAERDCKIDHSPAHRLQATPAPDPLLLDEVILDMSQSTSPYI